MAKVLSQLSSFPRVKRISSRNLSGQLLKLEDRYTLYVQYSLLLYRAGREGRAGRAEGRFLGKDNGCVSNLVIYMNYLSMTTALTWV